MSDARPQANTKRGSASIRFIEQFLGAGPSGGRLTALLLGQLDAFNRISTTFGRDQLGAFCKEHVKRLRGVLPPGTPIIRLSERRFAVLLALDSIAGVMDAAALIAEDNPPQMQMGDDTFLVDVTIGIAVYPTHADDASSLFRRAELALKEAREQELGFDMYRPDATQQQAALWKLESDLEQAVRGGELEVYFQPKLDLKNGKIGGVEALLRWRTKSGRFVPPDDFIPLAERSGSIVSMTWLVFDRVASAAQQWSTFGDEFSVAVNIAPQVLINGGFSTRLRELRSRLDRRNVRLIIELTEDSLVHSGDAALDTLASLRELGVGLAIDDFGKGYSSLSYLKQIPATEIKIDKRFIGAIAIDDKDRQIVKAVIELGHALGMRVVAEGVDNAESLAVVEELGCEMAQGFFIARPMRADLIADWVTSQSSTARTRGSSLSVRIGLA
jgi:EAL domain-containing protein (putative c-di-GMP-specific phosphodiesterase class I)/GGDEF domain-containing protein